MPSWEAVRRIYWPIDDEDIRVVPGQEGGPSLRFPLSLSLARARARSLSHWSSRVLFVIISLYSPEERLELSKEMLAMCEVFDWHRVRRALWFGAGLLL